MSISGVRLCLARHRFAARPASYCDASWLPAQVQGEARDPSSRPQSRLARLHVDRWLLGRLSAVTIEDAQWSLPGLRLALLPDELHRVLLEALGLSQLRVRSDASLSNDRRVADAVDVAQAIAPSSEVRIDASLVPAAALGTMVRRLGEVRLRTLIQPLPRAVRARWYLRLTRDGVRERLRGERSETLDRLAALEHRLASASSWDGLPCW